MCKFRKKAFATDTRLKMPEFTNSQILTSREETKSMWIRANYAHCFMPIFAFSY